MHRRHYLALDGLRGVAALAVVMFHRRWWGPGGHFLDSGYLAVNFFFILSGSVIDHAYGNRLRGQLSFARFALIRTIRLYPLIVAGVAIGVSLPLLKSFYHHDVHEALKLILAAAIAGLCLPLPAGLASQPFLLDRPLWSLFFELIANAVYALLLFRLSLKALIVLAGAGLVASIVTAHEFGTLLVGYKPGELPWGLACVFPPFIVGIILNRIKDIKHVRRMPRLPFWAATIILVLTFVPFSLGSTKPAYELVMVFGVYPLLILCAQQVEPSGRWASIAKTSAYLSYPLYALHYPVLDAADGALAHVTMSNLLRLLIATLAAVVVAFVAARFETPVRDALGRKWNSRSAAAGGGVDPQPALTSES